jgi:hypothetical protein
LTPGHWKGIQLSEIVPLYDGLVFKAAKAVAAYGPMTLTRPEALRAKTFCSTGAPDMPAICGEFYLKDFPSNEARLFDAMHNSMDVAWSVAV